jgi:hypothetical protein
MGANNYGNANITFRYKHPAKAENFNSVLRGVCPSGIYRGGTVSYKGNVLTLAPYTAIFESSIDKATTVSTASAIDLSTVTTFGGNASSTTPYIIMRYTYSNVISNYPDYYQVAFESIQTTDIIICKVLFDGGGVVTGIDYSEAHTAPQYNKDLNIYNIACDTYVKGKKINKEVTTAIDANTVTNELTCDTSLFFSPTADRTLNITAGASFADTDLYIYNNGTDYKVTVTYFTGSTVDLTPSMFIKFKWNGVRWICVAESRIGKIDHGYIVPRGGAELNGGLRTKDALWKYIQTYYASLIDTESNWQAGAVGKFVDYDSTQYRIPDFRGLFERNAGTNLKRLMANGSAFAGGSSGSVDDDMMQGHWHDRYRTATVDGGAGGSAVVESSGSGNKTLSTASNYPIRNPRTDGVNGTPRTGAETKPASISLIPFIYFED